MTKTEGNAPNKSVSHFDISHSDKLVNTNILANADILADTDYHISCSLSWMMEGNLVTKHSGILNMMNKNKEYLCQLIVF